MISNNRHPTHIFHMNTLIIPIEYVLSHYCHMIYIHYSKIKDYFAIAYKERDY